MKSADSEVSFPLGTHVKKQKSRCNGRKQSFLATLSARTASVEANVLKRSAPQSWRRSQRPPS